MNIYYDSEFLEDGSTIDLISIGMVAEDGREFYAVNSEAPWDQIKKDDWLVRNVLPSLPVTAWNLLDTYVNHSPNLFPRPSISLVGPDLSDKRVRPRQVIANEVRDFILAAPAPSLWADYCSYDHVVLCQLWGPMIDLPPGVPMWTHDLRQEAERYGNPALPSLPGVIEHNALSDAREVKFRHEWLQSYPDGAQ